MKKTFFSASDRKTEKGINVFCGELCRESICSAKEINLVSDPTSIIQKNIVVGLQRFINNPHSLSDERISDLLQIAAYVHCADRLADRGDRHSVNNNGWDRSFIFHIPVRNLSFWNKEETKAALNYALSFMTGDRHYDFDFIQIEKDVIEEEKAQQSMFLNEYLNIEDAEKTDVMLFSGGLDSLAGAIQRLEEFSDRKICLVSHKSNKVVDHNLKKIREYLRDTYGNRIIPYSFECHNTKYAKSKEETQRTRMFLFSAIAFAICVCYKKKELFIYENGVTSLNLPKQVDVFNARASRTTHPKTIGLLQKFLNLFGYNIQIITPFYNETKADIISIFAKYHREGIISSSVSCSSSRKMSEISPHCGKCSQCIDRIFAMYAAGLDDYDAAYSYDIISHIPDSETNQRVYNTLHFALHQDIHNPTDLYEKYGSEVDDIIAYWPNGYNPEDTLNDVFNLLNRYCNSIQKAAQRIRFKNEEFTEKPYEKSLLAILNNKTYLETPFALKVAEIDRILKSSIPKAFQHQKPNDENDFNDKIQAILSTKNETFSREYPIIEFGLTSYRADHAEGSLLIESKYIREKTTPTVAAKGIAVDIVEIPDRYGIMFIVFDPYRNIPDDEKYINAFEEKRENCYVKIYR